MILRQAQDQKLATKIKTNQKTMDIKQAPKQFCENINIGFTEEYFVMMLRSGQQASVYALTPEHAERLRQYLENQISEYEKKFGKKIVAKWVPGQKGPIQISDLEEKNKKD